jgi:hypothetical protein
MLPRVATEYGAALVGSGHQVRSRSGRQVRCAHTGSARLVARQTVDKVVPHIQELVADVVRAIAL